MGQPGDAGRVQPGVIFADHDRIRTEDGLSASMGLMCSGSDGNLFLPGVSQFDVPSALLK